MGFVIGLLMKLNELIEVKLERLKIPPPLSFFLAQSFTKLESFTVEFHCD